jgi:adenosylhomocysteine nucleosidase
VGINAKTVRAGHPGRDQSPVAIFAALKEEAEALTRCLDSSMLSSPKLSLWVGSLEGTPVVLAITGVGKVAAALATQFVIDTFKPRCAVAIGLAGATENDTAVGQLIVASGALQHDVDARPLVDARGMLPGLRLPVFPADPALSERLGRAGDMAVERPHTVRSGVILTGDQIITSREVRDRLLRDFPDGVCFDMETAAIAQVANQNQLPWAAIRITSDAADESFDLAEVMRFGTGTAAEMFARVVRAALRAPTDC